MLAHSALGFADVGHMAYRTEIIPPESAVDVHWSATAKDPNDPRVVVDRARILADAWRPAVHSRIEFICGRVAGRTVLDIGCVAHDEARMESSDWLHRRIAHLAASCVGADVLDEGVAAMTNAGFDAVCHDLSNGLGPLAARGPFQVMVAGELIEHVANLDMLFAAAAAGLAADGELIITTPNPYAPARVRAGRRGDVWENADHIMYAFPSGIAELAARHGLVLAQAMTTEPTTRTLINPVRWVKRMIKGSQWHRRGFSTTVGVVRPVTLDRRDRLDRIRWKLSAKMSSSHQFIGETFIYVIQRDTLL